MGRQTSPVSLCLLIALTGCGTTRHDTGESGTSGDSSGGSGSGLVTAGGASSGGASSVGSGGAQGSVGVGGASSVGVGGASSVGVGGASAVAVGGASSVGAGGAGAGNVDAGSNGNGVGGAEHIPTVDGEPECSPWPQDIGTFWCQSAGCEIAEISFLYCDASYGSVDFIATSPDDVYFVATATAMQGPVELPTTLEQVFVIEKHGEVFTVEPGPQTNGACRIGLLDGDVVLACADGQSVTYSRRSEGIWQTETVAAADATLGALIVSDDGSVTISAAVAAADSTTDEFVRYHRDAQGNFSSQVLVDDMQGLSALTLDGNSVPVWATWQKPNDYELLLFQSEGSQTLGTSVKIPARVGFAPWGDSVAPAVVATGDRPVAYLPGDGGHSELFLTDAPVDETTCPLAGDSDCATVDTMCNWYGDSYDAPIAVATDTHGTIIAYRHVHNDSDRHVYNCTATCACESTELANRGYQEFVLAQLPATAGGALTTLLTLDSELRAPDKMMATGETLHMMYGEAYVALDMSGL